MIFEKEEKKCRNPTKEYVLLLKNKQKKIKKRILFLERRAQQSDETNESRVFVISFRERANNSF